MAKMRKSGLHKEISTIFDGVQVPNGNGQAGSSSSTIDRSAGHIPPTPNVTPSRITQSVVAQDKLVESTVKPAAAGKPQKPKIQMPSAFKKVSFSGLNKFFEQIQKKLFAPKPGVSPTKQKVMVALMPVLIVIVIFVFGRNFMGSGGKKSKPQSGLMSPSAAAAKKEINWQRPAPYPENMRDPMKEYAVHIDASPVKGDIVVRGIVWSQDNPSAVIGTEILYQSETVQGAKIIKINQDSVEFERDGEKWTQKVAGY
ncbi:MAG: hypothetical protein JW804_02690 [Sedimentisphaerales bacterium]|nr:hypothetical protein [Sedimentisphaerales bacterium]